MTILKKGKKIFLKCTGIILGIVALVCVLGAIANVITLKINMNKIQNFPNCAKEDALVPVLDENGYYTFTTDEEFKILDFSDTHIGGGWLSFKKDAMALNAVAAMVAAEKPDLVIITGDVVYPVGVQSGTLNNKTSAMLFAKFMEQLGVYWTVNFGNHDTEVYSYYSRKAISEFYESEEFEHCLFQAGPEDIDGYGNTVINVKNSKGLITQSLVLMDSHSYTDHDYFGLMWKYDNIHENQIEWYKNTINSLNEYNSKVLASLGDEISDADKAKYETVKSLMFIHIPLEEYGTAWNEYRANGYKNTENAVFHYGVAGEPDEKVYCGINHDEVFETVLELGSTKGIFCGHDHKNNYSIEYKGVRLTYAMSVDYLAYIGISKEGRQRGCTTISVSPDTSFEIQPHNYYTDNYETVYPKEEVTM